MPKSYPNATLMVAVACLATVALAQTPAAPQPKATESEPSRAPSVAAPTGPGGGPPSMSAAQRAEATREFLGLGPKPDAAAAAAGAPIFAASCAFCHGPQARGAEGPSLITSQLVLDDERGEKLMPFLKHGRPDKGMPSFATVSDSDLYDVAEFLHQQVEDVANRGTYKLPDILVGDADKGKTYFDAHCTACHSIGGDLAHIGSRYHAPADLQRNWVWPPRTPPDGPAAITATVATASGTLSGRVTQVSDFTIALVDAKGAAHVIQRGEGVTVTLHDPLAPHNAMIATLRNGDMHDVTAYLEAQK